VMIHTLTSRELDMLLSMYRYIAIRPPPDCHHCDSQQRGGSGIDCISYCGGSSLQEQKIQAVSATAI
jgi:hypothetical protein